jgi:NYN domain-containing protein
MHFYPTERIALFIDGANLYATAKALGFDIDYKRLLALFRGIGHVIRRALLPSFCILPLDAAQAWPTPHPGKRHHSNGMVRSGHYARAPPLFSIP